MNWKKKAFICTSHLLVHGSTFSETDLRTQRLGNNFIHSARKIQKIQKLLYTLQLKR